MQFAMKPATTSIDEATTWLPRLCSLPAASARQQLDELQALLPAANAPETLEAIANAIPKSVAMLAPEVCLSLQELGYALRAYQPVIPDDIDALPERLWIGWLRVQLATPSPKVSSWLADIDVLRQVRIFTNWAVADVLAPLELLLHLGQATDPRLRKQLLEWLPSCMAQAALTPDQAFHCLQPLLTDVEPTIQRAAIALLASSWLQDLSTHEEREREAFLAVTFKCARGATLEAVTDVIAGLGLRKILSEALTEGEPEVQAQVLRVFGGMAIEEDLDLVFVLTEHEPLRFHAPAKQFLLEAHRQGVFLRSKHIGPVLQLFDQHEGWTAEELFRVTYIVRHDLLTELQALPANDPRWRRRAAILAVHGSELAANLFWTLLSSTDDLANAAAFLRGASESPAFEEDFPLMKWLGQLPEEALDALSYKASTSSLRELKRFAEDPLTDNALRQKAIEVIWAHTDNRVAWRDELVAKIGPHESRLLGTDFLAKRDASLAQHITNPPWEESPHYKIKADKELEILCESGDAQFLPRIESLFRKIFRGYVQKALRGDFSIKRVKLPELEQMIFRCGRHLCNAGYVIRSWREAGPETGRDLVLRFVCDWLDEEPAESICVALLEVVARHKPSRVTLQRIMHLWRHRHAGVQRAAIEAILAAGEKARGLELSLCRLIKSDDPRIIVQALNAAQALEAEWAEPMVLDALSHPEMSVKKAAAEGLTVLGSSRAVPALVGWLSRHDNNSFRSYLLAALEHVAGAGWVALLIQALPPEEERSTGLLYDALSGHIPAAALLRLARSEEPAHRALVEACLDGRIRPKDASTAQLAAMLHRTRLLPKAKNLTPQDPVVALHIHGMTPERAQVLLEYWQALPDTHENKEEHATRTRQVLDVVRKELAAWLSWRPSAPTELRVALDLLLLQAATPSHEHLMEALLSCAEESATTLPAQHIIDFVKRCLCSSHIARSQSQRGLALLRQLPPTPGGLVRYQLLKSCGAVRTEDDLRACLQSCLIGADVATESVSLLVEALQIPRKRDDEPETITTLREEASRWFQTEQPERDAWLRAAVQQYPLDVAPLSTLPKSSDEKDIPPPSIRLAALTTTLCDASAPQQERERAATLLLDWPDTKHVWHHILEAYVEEHIDLHYRYLGHLAPHLGDLTVEAASTPRVLGLLRTGTPYQQRSAIKVWLAAWAAGEAVTQALPDAFPSRLLEALSAKIKAGEYQFGRLLGKSSSLQNRTMIAILEERAPDEIRHLLDVEEPPAPVVEDDELVDPIEGLSVRGLVSLIKEKSTDTGLAVRAVHALATHKASSSLEPWITDGRPQVRSAALRAYRKVASKGETMEASRKALQIETRQDVLRQLMRSLSHAKYAPALPTIMEYLLHKNTHVSRAAEDALRTWGEDAIAPLEHAAKRARPDRSERYQELIATIAQKTEQCT